MEFFEYLPFWNQLSVQQQQLIAEVVEYRKVAKGTHIHDSSSECLGLVMVRSGQLRTYILSEDGREITHEKIASHLGTAREVVTRMLRYFQNEGMVKLTRGTIEIVDDKKMKNLCKL